MPKRFNQLAVEATAPAPDDVLPIDGATNATRRLRANRIQEWDSTRSAGGYLWSDGTTANRAIVQTPGARGNLAGAPVASCLVWVDVPTSPWGTGGNASTIAAISGSAIVSPNNTINNLHILGGGSGLFITQMGAVSTSNARGFSWNGFQGAYAGQRIWLEVRFARGSANPVVRVNGIDISSSFTLTTLGTFPEWLDAGLSTTNFLTGFNWPAGIAPLGRWLNAHLTDAESDAWRITGRPPAWAAMGGSCQALISSATRNSDFSAGATDWTSGTATVAVTAGQLVITRTASTDQFAGLASNFFREPFILNARYRLRVNIVANTGLVRFRSAGVSFANFMTDTSSTGLQTYEFTYVGQGTWTGLEIGLIGGAGGATASVTIDDLFVERLGALSEPAVQPIPVVRDLTVIGGNQGRLVGMQPVISEVASPFSIIDVPAQAYTAGTWVQILGGAIIGNRRRRIVSVSGNSSANTTIDLGTNGSTAGLVSAQTANGDFDVATFAGRIVPAGASLWVRFAGATTANVTLQLAPA